MENQLRREKKNKRTLESLGLISEKANKSKVSLKKDITVQFEALRNVNIFKKFYNHFHDILRLSDVLPNFPFTTSEMMRDYYL